jgi:hypothetical protein
LLTTLVLPLAALWLGVPDPAEGFPAAGEVVAASLSAFVAPEASSVAPERLHRGDRVTVIDSNARSGWLTIQPPAGAFSWVEGSAVQTDPTGQARVIAARASVRVGVPKARLPGPPRAELERGATVRLLDRPPLIVGATTWLAIEPTAGEVRYVRGESVRIERSEPPRETAAAYRPDDAPAASIPGLPPALAAEVSQIEAEHRAALSESVENWRLDGVRKRYELLLKSLTDSAQVSAINDRIAHVASQQEAARAAKLFLTLLARSRHRDHEVDGVRRGLAEAERPRRRPYAAEGMVQATSKQVEGRRVYVMIGSEGTPVAYLDVPPGLDPRPVLAKRAGVRGSVHYNEALGARLIAVKDLEPLE